MAITDPQIVPSTLASDLDIISFTVEHYPGDALGIATAAPRIVVKKAFLLVTTS